MPATSTTSPLALRVLTLNIHKGFGHVSGRFILHDLREAVRQVLCRPLPRSRLPWARLSDHAPLAAEITL